MGDEKNVGLFPLVVRPSIGLGFVEAGGWWMPLGLKAKLVRVFLPGHGTLKSTAQRPTHTLRLGRSPCERYPNASRGSPHAHSFSAVPCHGQMVAPPATRASELQSRPGSSYYRVRLSRAHNEPSTPPNLYTQPGGPGERTTYLATDRGAALLMTRTWQHGHPAMTYKPSLAMRTTA